MTKGTSEGISSNATPDLASGSTDVTKPKRKKTNRACNHCHKAHMTCDSGRPCKRCIQRGLSKSCEDAPRKRKKYLVDVPNSKLSNGASLVPPIENNLDSKHIPFQTDMFQDPRNNNIPVPNDNLLNGDTYASLNYDLPQQQNSLSHAMSNPSETASTPNPVSNNLGHQIEGSQHSLQQAIHQQSRMMNSLQQPIQAPLSHPLQHEFQSQNLTASYQPLSQPMRASFNTTRSTNFLSSAADMEYSTLSNILQENFAHPSTSTEGTPNSMSISPSLSFQNSNGQLNKKPVTNHLPAYFTDISHTPSPTNSISRGVTSNVLENSLSLKCDESINQYFLGPTGNDHVSMFPEVITGIKSMKAFYPEIYKERRSRSALSFAIGIISDDRNYASQEQFKEPEEVYVKVKHPYSYTPGFHSLIAYLRKRFPKEMLVKMAESMAAYRPSFIACTNSLKEGDLIFMEQCFQRTLLTYDNLIRVSGTPTIVWRRTGEIAYVGSEFCILTGWEKEELLQQKKFIVELLDDKSVVEYFELFSKIAFGDFLGATMTECTLLTPNQNVKIRTGCIWTLKRDVFGIPMMIIGNFLPIV